MNFLLILGAVYGAIIGSALASFACVISDRAPRGEPFVGGRSHCACGRQLKAYENVPVLGWVRVWGRARCCGARIPGRYVLAEVAGAGVGVGYAYQAVTWVLAGVAVGWVVLATVGCAIALVWLVATVTGLPMGAAARSPREG